MAKWREKDKEKEEKAEADKAAASRQVVNFADLSGSELAGALDFPSTEGLQIKLNFGAGVVNPYDILGCVYQVQTDGSVKKPAMPPMVVKDAKLVSQAITNSQRCRKFVKKGVLLEGGLSGLVSASFKDESVVEATVTQIANYIDRYGDVIDWKRLVSYKSLFSSGTYIIITAFSDLEIALTECKTFNPKLDVTIGLVKVNGEVYSINEFTSRYRVALANYALLDTATVSAIEQDLKAAAPAPTLSIAAAAAGPGAPSLRAALKSGAAPASRRPSAAVARKAQAELNGSLWETLVGARPAKRGQPRVSAEFIKVRRRA